MKQEKIDEYLECMLWLKQMKETNNDSFLPLFFDEHRYLVLCGGGGSGKSVTACRKVLERVTTEPGHRYLVCRKVGRSIKQSCFKQMLSMCGKYYSESGYKPNKTDLTISFDNGSEIICSGLDDTEKLKSIFDVTGIWIEEASEVTESDFNQLDIRLRTDFPYYLQIILSFNPISIQHWLKKRFFDKKDPDATTHRSTYKDNRFLIPAARKVLENYKDTDEYYYQVYCLGQWGVTGKSFFNASAISERLTRIPEPIRRGFFSYTEAADKIHISDVKWTEDEDGPISIYAEPQNGRPYVIGGDTAGEGSDYFTGQVLDNISGEQVCVLRHQYDEDTYAKQMYCLGMYYNEALIGIETNFSTYPVKLLGLMGYKRQYLREVEDNYKGQLKSAFGFRTTPITRPVILAELKRVLRYNMDKMTDSATLEEMLTFVRNDKLRPEAAPGAHDDLVMALAIAYYIRPQHSMEAPKEEGEKNRWTEDMWDDYNKASARDREVMVSLWGEPD